MAERAMPMIAEVVRHTSVSKQWRRCMCADVVHALLLCRKCVAAFEGDTVSDGCSPTVSEICAMVHLMMALAIQQPIEQVVDGVWILVGLARWCYLAMPSETRWLAWFRRLSQAQVRPRMSRKTHVKGPNGPSTCLILHPPKACPR